ncbi:FixH family protein [Spongiibacter taiwanensis]|uniref:FixH family protein n=1 Tax=Spongiibacter taiwanensis TaxID=1748242 RepID=UPI0020359DFD|nr:FixH family protein [Spongiibacter taiwanensis]USA43029.1 FixH family protein [Spongiibacter taiwanensis]
MISSHINAPLPNPQGERPGHDIMNTPRQPWFTQFWPWFLIILPSVVVVAAIATVYIAIKHSDELVIDTYYKEGLAINQQLSQNQQARQQAVVAKIYLNPSMDLRLQLTGEGLAQINHLQLRLQHPTTEALDQSVVLTRRDGEWFEGRLGQPLLGVNHLGAPSQSRWYLTLQPFHSEEYGNWRLKGEWDMSKKTLITLWAKGALEK